MVFNGNPGRAIPTVEVHSLCPSSRTGTYGFRIVVHSKDGLTGTGPSTGDPADIWITVDTEKPQTRINSVPYGRGREAGQLVINYTVNDSELTLRPITLAL